MILSESAHMPGEGGPADVLAGRANWAVVEGEALALLRALPDSSVDAIVQDPPSATGFMQNAWDSDKGGRDQWIAWLAEIMAEALRVLKPGGHALVWALPRTSHWTGMALEDAGFEIRDRIAHVFSQGWPKSLDVSKAAAKAQIGDAEDVAALEGLGTGLKPAVEDWWLCRKPLERGATVVSNVLEWGTGGLNIEACRVPVSNGGAPGRWPPHLTHDGSPEVAALFPVSERPSGKASGPTLGKLGTGATYGTATGENMGESAFYGDTGSAARFFPALPPDLDDILGATLVYQGKATRADRNEGLEGMEERPLRWSNGDASPGTFQSAGTHRAARNSHPCVKSTALCRWLCRLITPPGGIVLDLFTGSGSTGKAAMLEGFRFIGSELNQGEDGVQLPYIEISRRRISAAWIVRNAQPRLVGFEFLDPVGLGPVVGPASSKKYLTSRANCDILER